MIDEEQRVQAQQVLDELLKEGLIPFALTAYDINTNGRGEYVVHFNDSRIRSCRFLDKGRRLQRRTSSRGDGTRQQNERPTG
jgi:hypothetical protein